MTRASGFTPFWSGQTEDGHAVRVYQKLVKHKSGTYYDLRALVTKPLHTSLGVFGEVIFSETVRDLVDDRACWKQISQWCNRHKWRKATPMEEVA